MKFMSEEYREKVYIIAEMSANHGGDIKLAKEIIHKAADAGADCIKIQTYTPDTLTIDCNSQYFHIGNGTWEGENLYQLYQKAYTPWEWQEELKREAENSGLDFLSSPFDRSAIDFLESIGIEFYKIASFELVDIPLIRYTASKRKPIILSTGMGTLAEIERAISVIRDEGDNEIVLLKCASAYPAVSDDMNLVTMKNMSETFGVPVGLSDHSLGTVAAITAVALGARVIEKHFCLSRTIKNPDSGFSMEPCEFKQMVQDIRAAERAIGSVHYGPTQQEVGSMIFRKSIFSVMDIKKGDMITKENIRVIRPGYGLEPYYYQELIGQKALRNIKRGTPISFDMIGSIH